jgi:hypothetical protein
LLGDLPELEVGLFVLDLPREAGMGDSFFVGTGAWGSGFISENRENSAKRTLNWSCFLARIDKNPPFTVLSVKCIHGDLTRPKQHRFVGIYGFEGTLCMQET